MWLAASSLGAEALFSCVNDVLGGTGEAGEEAGGRRRKADAPPWAGPSAEGPRVWRRGRGPREIFRTGIAGLDDCCGAFGSKALTRSLVWESG